MNTPKMMEAKAASILGVSSNVLAKLSREGLGPRYTSSRSIRLYEQSDLDEYLSYGVIVRRGGPDGRRAVVDQDAAKRYAFDIAGTPLPEVRKPAVEPPKKSAPSTRRTTPEELALLEAIDALFRAKALTP